MSNLQELRKERNKRRKRISHIRGSQIGSSIGSGALGITSGTQIAGLAGLASTASTLGTLSISELGAATIATGVGSIFGIAAVPVGLASAGIYLGVKSARKSKRIRKQRRKIKDINKEIKLEKIRLENKPDDQINPETNKVNEVHKEIGKFHNTDEDTHHKNRIKNLLTKENVDLILRRIKEYNL